MKEIIDKISSYNIFNYLFPGVLFVVLLKEITNYDLIQENNLIGAFLYYFIGLSISRIGSLIIGFYLQKNSKFKFAKYSDYIKASEKDNKVELFSEVNNMYRTIISLLFLLLLAKVYSIADEFFEISVSFSSIFIIILLIILFIFSYKKQTGFIVKRVKNKTKNKDKEA